MGTSRERAPHQTHPTECFFWARNLNYFTSLSFTSLCCPALQVASVRHPAMASLPVSVRCKVFLRSFFPHFPALIYPVRPDRKILRNAGEKSAGKTSKSSQIEAGASKATVHPASSVRGYIVYVIVRGECFVCCCVEGQEVAPRWCVAAAFAKSVVLALHQPTTSGWLLCGWLFPQELLLVQGRPRQRLFLLGRLPRWLRQPLRHRKATLSRLLAALPAAAEQAGERSFPAPLRSARRLSFSCTRQCSNFAVVRNCLSVGTYSTIVS